MQQALTSILLILVMQVLFKANASSDHCTPLESFNSDHPNHSQVGWFKASGDKIFLDAKCGTRTDAIWGTLDKCMRTCRFRPGCNAINFGYSSADKDRNTWCELFECGESIPEADENPWESLYAMTGYYFSDTDQGCIPLSVEECEAAADKLGLAKGGLGYSFQGAYSTKGCYAYNNGKYNGRVYFGTGGTVAQMKENVNGDKFRPSDCAGQTATGDSCFDIKLDTLMQSKICTSAGRRRRRDVSDRRTGPTVCNTIEETFCQKQKRLGLCNGLTAQYWCMETCGCCE